MDPSNVSLMTEIYTTVGATALLGAMAYGVVDYLNHAKKAKLNSHNDEDVFSESAKPSELELKVESLPYEGRRVTLKDIKTNKTYIVLRNSDDEISFQEYIVKTEKVGTPR